MLNREIFLVASSQGNKLAEFLVELNFDQPGILATLSNIFAEHDVNIINIAIDAPRRHLHFIVDVTMASEEQLREMTKQLGMFAFVRKVKYRVSNVPIFVPRWIIHVINGSPSVSFEKELVGLQDFVKIAEELGRRDAKTIKGLVSTTDLLTVEEAIYLAQLRGMAVVESTAIEEGRLVARLCNLAHPLARKYLEALLGGLGLQFKTVEEGSCLRLEV
ncbi:MAG: ACT domain-containing protein [Pyrobaculum sp.]